MIARREQVILSQMVDSDPFESIEYQPNAGVISDEKLVFKPTLPSVKEISAQIRNYKHSQSEKKEFVTNLRKSNVSELKLLQHRHNEKKRILQGMVEKGEAFQSYGMREHKVKQLNSRNSISVLETSNRDVATTISGTKLAENPLSTMNLGSSVFESSRKFVFHDQDPTTVRSKYSLNPAQRLNQKNFEDLDVKKFGDLRQSMELTIKEPKVRKEQRHNSLGMPDLYQEYKDVLESERSSHVRRANVS